MKYSSGRLEGKAGVSLERIHDERLCTGNVHFMNYASIWKNLKYVCGGNMNMYVMNRSSFVPGGIEMLIKLTRAVSPSIDMAAEATCAVTGHG